MAQMQGIAAAVEGPVEEAVIKKLLALLQAKPGAIYGKKGRDHIKKKISAYNQAAQRAPWIILVDLEQDPCAPALRQDWLPKPAPFLCFRVAVRTIEAWLLADRQNIAQFLRVKPSQVPVNPEQLDQPKTTMVNLARSSRRRDIRQDMVPRPGSGRQVGPAYTARLIEFVADHWQPDVASQHAPSLVRAIGCLQSLVNRYRSAGLLSA